jgi:hypothetical protein
MKTKTLKLAALALLLAGTLVACNNETDDSIKLQGTTWKLVGFADVETGTLRKAVPEDCKSCYTVRFLTDTVFSGTSCTNKIDGYYHVDYGIPCSIDMVITLTTEVVEYFDGELFVKNLSSVQSFSIQEDELKLYYNDKKNYLLFKLKTT